MKITSYLTFIIRSLFWGYVGGVCAAVALTVIAVIVAAICAVVVFVLAVAALLSVPAVVIGSFVDGADRRRLRTMVNHGEQIDSTSIARLKLVETHGQRDER